MIQDTKSLFHIPQDSTGHNQIYLCGNSLGLMPRSVPDYINQELDDWRRLGVEGHLHARHPWLPYHEQLTESMSRILGARPHEVVVMNGLTANLHLMMVSFYRPSAKRYKILMEYNPFPSDRYAAQSQVSFHGYDPDDAIIELPVSREDREIVSNETIRDILAKHGEEIALILIGGVNYYTGQAYDMAEITRLGHTYGCKVGFDLAHAAGNLDVRLSDFGPDFAVWCTYKYLNSGPGNLSGCYVNERHHHDDNLPRFSGWWGHDKSRRFLMEPKFKPISTVEAWQLSNPPILAMAAIRASLDIFDTCGIEFLREKSIMLTNHLYESISSLDQEEIEIITPSDSDRRGCQLSLRMVHPDKKVFDRLTAAGVIADWREPDVIRIAPVPLYNDGQDVDAFVLKLRDAL
jgi:kynureninase